jgi:DNA invertase Pin-like site-specific DNA recombinase
LHILELAQRTRTLGLGLQAQRAVIEHYAKLEGAEIVKEYIESESGKNIENRPSSTSYQ